MGVKMRRRAIEQILACEKCVGLRTDPLPVLKDK